MWHIMLSVLDKGHLELADGISTNFGNTIIFMTSNAGAAEMASAMGDRLGFGPVSVDVNQDKIRPYRK